MVENADKPSTMARQSVVGRKGSLSLTMRSGRKSVAGSMARAYKLAQYFRVLPCIYTEQVFCFSACLLKWYRLEAMRLEALATTGTKMHHQDKSQAPVSQPSPTPETAVQDSILPEESQVDGEKEENKSDDQALSSLKPTNSGFPSTEGEIANENDPQRLNKVDDTDQVNEGQDENKEESEMETNYEQQPDRPPYGLLNKTPLAKIPYANSQEKRNTLRLAFNSMKYQAILDKLLDETSFYSEYPELKDEDTLILVLCYDYTMRNFQRRTPLNNERSLPMPTKPTEVLPTGRVVLHPPGQETFKIAESAVQGMCLRLAAAVARIRVRNQVGSLKLLLPEEWRKSEQLGESMPTYGWYNQLLGKQDIVTGWLKDHGYKRIVAGRPPQSLEYASDKHCPDVFVFNKNDVEQLVDSEIVVGKNLVLQDKSSCLAVHCTLSNVGGGEELLFVNCINVYTAVHMEGLIMNKFPLIQPVPQIRCIRQFKEDEDLRLPVRMGSKVIKATAEEFLSLEPNSEKNKPIRHIFIEASDTRSGLVNPVGFLEVENEDSGILKDMWTPPGHPTKEPRRAELINKTSGILRHALKFSGVRTVTLLCHTEDPEETDLLVARVVEAYNRILLREAEALASSSRGGTTGTAFNPQVPFFPGLQEENEALEMGKPSIIAKNKFIRVPASTETNGFVIAILNKETILLKSDDLKADADQQGKSGKETRGKGKAKKPVSN